MKNTQLLNVREKYFVSYFLARKELEGSHYNYFRRKDEKEYEMKRNHCIQEAKILKKRQINKGQRAGRAGEGKNRLRAVSF